MGLHITKKNLKAVTPYNNIKCAGMPEKCKELFKASMLQLSKETWETERKEEWDKMKEDERNFVLTPRSLTDFCVGLIVPGKLVPKRIRGGILLVETTYEMR